MRTRSVSVYSLRSEKPQVPESAPCFTENVFEVDFFFCNFDGLLKVYSTASFIVLVFVTEAHRYRQLPHTYMDICFNMQHTYTRTSIQTLTDTYINSHTHTNTRTHIHPRTHKRTQKRRYTHEYVHTHAQARIHTHRHAHAHSLLFSGAQKSSWQNSGGGTQPASLLLSSTFDSAYAVLSLVPPPR